MYNLNQFVMIKKHLLGGALLVSVLVLLTGCKEMMSSLDNPVSAYFEVTPTQATIAKNQTCQISYSTISDGKVTFKSSAENIATVDAKGLVTGKTAGTAIITVELAATPYYQGATKNVEVTVDAVLSIDATEVTVGYGASINLVKDYHLARKGEATINYEIIEGGDFITLDETTKDITGKACGNAKVKVSVPASTSASSDELVIDVKARVQNLAQLVAVIGSGDEPFAYLADDVAITLPAADFDLTGKKVTIKGDDKKPATFTMGAVTTAGVTVSDNFTLKNVKVQAASMGTKPFIYLNNTTAVAKKADGSDSDHKLINTITLEGVEIYGLKDAFITDAQKTLLENLIIENSIIEVPASSANVINFKDKGYVGKVVVNNSTIYAKGNNTGFFAQYGSRPKNVNGDWLQVFDVQNSTIVNIANGKNVCDLKQNGTAQNVNTLKNNIFVNTGKSGQVVVGFNKGQTSATPIWDVTGNNFSVGTENKNAAEIDKAGKKDDVDIVQNCVDGIPAFNDAANGDFHQTNVKTGDKRWYEVN
jgi:hypothetical protein